MMTIDHSHVTDVEEQIIVRFASVITLPVTINGRVLIVYVGVPELMKLIDPTKTLQPATDADLIEAARRLELYQQALPALERQV